MPRYQPPKEYYTATQVKQILNISGAMIANYVDKGRIKHVVPPGRKHGFYLKADVDKLANELQAFFDLEEETEETVFTTATAKDLSACIALNRELFSDAHNSADDKTLIKKWATWLKKNPEIIYILKREKEVIGIATVLPFMPNSERFEHALLEDVSFLLGDVNLSTDDIEMYTHGNRVQLYIAEIGIKQSLSRDIKRREGATLISKCMQAIVDLGKRGVIIDRVTSVGASKSGIKLLQHIGFSQVKFPRQDTKLFVLDMQESGARTAEAYREALKEQRVPTIKK
ncbi:MAG: hypothetical protein H0U76_02605 [Ktedonobacteraceae bacterium]|nr:hypothetical protein [Ktedonobacteraceae bacterium]MBA3825035.1 hypothetical protein [Ktedonobacterales bacterium]